MAFVVDKADYRGWTAAVSGRLLPHLSQAVIGGLLLASACAAGAQNANAAQNEAASAPRYHIVKPGETLTLLARQYEVSLQDIVSANRLTDANRLGAGQPLLIPRARQVAGSQRTPQRPEPRRPPRTQRSISLTFAGVDISDVLDQIARYAKTDILLTPGAKGTVTLSLQNRTPDEAIRLAAAAAGLTAVNAGGVYMVGPAAEVKQAVAEYGQTEVVPLRYMTPAEAADVLTRAVPTVRAEASKNAVVITGLPTDLAAARAALNNLDVQAAPPRETTRQTNVVTLRYADPENAERVLTEAIPDLKVTRQDRTLILNGTAADLETATRAIQSLDTEAPKPIETQQVLVYHLRYLNAQRAEEALKKALPDLTITVGPEPIAPPTANFNPLSSGLLGGGGNGGAGGGGGLSFGGGGGGGGGFGGGGASGATGTTGGAGGGTAAAQPLSRATRLILIGAKSELDVARSLLEQTDVPQPAVRIEALLVEVTETGLKNLGIAWSLTNENTPTSFPFTIPGGNGLDFGQITRGNSSFSVTLQALVNQNQARILARPNISVLDNEDASIFIGDLRRFPGAVIVTPNAGNIQAIETIPIGIALLVRPRIHPDGQVTLKVHPVVSTVSSVDQFGPQIASREADTTVRLHEGEELVIGGLDRSEVRSTLLKVPILGDIPLIGELFRSRRRETTKNEIVVVIRAYPLLTDPAPPHDFRRSKE